MNESSNKMEVKHWKKPTPIWEILWAVYTVEQCSEYI